MTCYTTLNIERSHSICGVASLPSSIVVSDRQSLAANFAENSKNVLCQAAFGAGAYAIGGRLLGLPALTPAGALVTAGALIAGLTLCPSNAEGGAIFGEPPAFSGGQCPVLYEWRVGLQIIGDPGPPSIVSKTVQGPLAEKRIEVRLLPNGTPFYWRVWRTVGDSQLSEEGLGASPNSSNIVLDELVRVDGQPDNCGNPPNSGGQIISSNSEGDTIDNSTVVNNQDYSLTIPISVDLGGISNVLNLRFGDIRIGSLLPLNFKINIGGVDFGFREKPEGDLEPYETSPDSESVTDKIEQLLKGIKECVCKPEVDMDLLYLPLVAPEVSCDITSAEFLVPKGSVDSALIDSFIGSAVLAKTACESSSPVQLAESQIFSGTTGLGGAEIFTEIIEPDVVSLKLVITDFDEESLPKISLYPDSNQRKFGSVNYCGDGSKGGGDYIYVFDNSTHIPLPKRAKPGRLRLLLKPGTSFIVFDTGERL